MQRICEREDEINFSRNSPTGHTAAGPAKTNTGYTGGWGTARSECKGQLGNDTVTQARAPPRRLQSSHTKQRSGNVAPVRGSWNVELEASWTISRGLTTYNTHRRGGDYKDPGPRTPQPDQATSKRTPADFLRMAGPLEPSTPSL